MKTNSKSVCIVVVTFNRLKLLKEEIDALRKQTFTDFQIVVVNNGSTDGTSEWLLSQKDIITITQENCGGAGGFHTGLKYATEHSYDYCWIMDDDVICAPNALIELYNAYHIEDNIGFVCSRVVGVDGRAMNNPSLGQLYNQKGTYSNIIGYVTDFGMVSVTDATFVSVFLSTEIVREVGLPYKEYFIWGDDSEYTRRIAYKHHCFVACNSVVVHKRAIQGDITFETETDPKRLKNYFYMYRNNYFSFMNDSHHGYIEKSAYRNKIFRKIRQLLFAGKKEQAFIIIKAIWAAYSFKPQIEYPKNIDR